MHSVHAATMVLVGIALVLAEHVKVRRSNTLIYFSNLRRCKVRTGIVLL